MQTIDTKIKSLGKPVINRTHYSVWRYYDGDELSGGRADLTAKAKMSSTSNMAAEPIEVPGVFLPVQQLGQDSSGGLSSEGSAVTTALPEMPVLDSASEEHIPSFENIVTISATALTADSDAVHVPVVTYSKKLCSGVCTPSGEKPAKLHKMVDELQLVMDNEGKDQRVPREPAEL